MSALRIRVDENELIIDGKRIPLVSGEMHFFRLDPDIWERCLRQIKELGVPIVATYLDWRRHSLGPDENDLTGRTDPRLNVPRFLELCKQVGLWVHLKPGPWICAEERNGGYPEWLVSDPDLQVLDSAGRVVQGYTPPFQSPIPSYLHPRYLRYVEKWVKDVTDCIRPYCYPNGPVILLQLDNEPSMTFHDRFLESDYNPVNVSPGGYYEQWLQTRYGSVEPLNTEPPRTVAITSLQELRSYMDWAAFKEWLLARHVSLIGDMYRRNGLDTVLFTVNYNERPQLAVPNNWKQLEPTDGFSGFDYYPAMPMSFDEIVKVAMAVNYSLAVLKVSWSPEIMTGIWKFNGAVSPCPLLQARDYEYLYLVCMAFGLKGMNFYMMVNRENWQQAPITERGDRTETARAVERVVQLMRSLPNFTRLRKTQEVAVLYYRPYAWEAFVVEDRQIEVEGLRLGKAYEWFVAAYRELLRLNLDPAIFDPWVQGEEQLIRFRMVVVPCGRYMDRTTQEMLRRYAEAGGTLVLVGEPPQFDLDMQQCSVLASWHVKEFLTAPNDLPQACVQHGLAPVVWAEDSAMLTLLHQHESARVLYLINTSSHPLRTVVRFRDIPDGTVKHVLTDDTVAWIRDGTVAMELPGRTVEVFLIHSS